MRATEARVPNILLVEDDPGFAQMLVDALGARSYRVWHAERAADVESLLDQVRPDLIVVDLMLPDRNGLLLCATLKAQAEVPVIICSATKRKDDALIGFKLGADDFIAKPFAVDELQARIELALQRALARPSPPEPAPQAQVQRLGDLVIDQVRCRVMLANQEIDLTPTEYRLLCAVARRPTHVISRQELAESVWGYHDSGVMRSLDVHMRRLRSKLNAGGGVGPRLTTRRGFGYQLVDELSWPTPG